MAEQPVADERVEPVVQDAAPTVTSPDLPPAPLRSEDLRVVRKVDPATGYVYSYYTDAQGNPLPLGETRHLQKANAGFIPPPT
jgi:hypothetical protein